MTAHVDPVIATMAAPVETEVAAVPGLYDLDSAEIEVLERDVAERFGVKLEDDSFVELVVEHVRERVVPVRVIHAENKSLELGDRDTVPPDNGLLTIQRIEMVADTNVADDRVENHLLVECEKSQFTFGGGFGDGGGWKSLEIGGVEGVNEKAVIALH